MRLTHLTTDQAMLTVGFEDEDAPEGTARRVELVFEPAEHGLTLAAVTVLRDEGRLIGRDTRIPLAAIEDEARRFAAFAAEMRFADASEPALGARLAAAAVVPARRTRRTISDAFLAKVAQDYRAAGGTIRGLTPDRDPAYAASDATKHRWVKAARERGLLGPRED
jgi:hypothetical protein